MVNVFVAGGLKTLTGGTSRLDLPQFPEGDLQSLVEALSARFGPSFGERLLANGELRKYVNVFVNGEDVRFRQGLDTPVRPEDVVDFIPAVAGG